MARNIYEERGYTSREEYIEALSVQHKVSIETVEALADILGEAEDFDGLISSLRDIAGQDIFIDIED